MTEIYTFAAFVIGGTMGFYLGDHFRELTEKVKTLQKDKNKAGVTPGAYKKADEFKSNPKSGSGVINPKTPQRMEFDNQEQLEKDSLGWGLRPK